MNRDDIEKLLGGYAAGTLTPAEREALFAAALEDQQLFESLAAEEPLRELLQDPAAKARLLAALDDRPAPWYRRLVGPALGIAAAAAMVLLAVFIRYEPPKPAPIIVAETRHVPIRSFQSPVPVEKSPLPTVLQSKPMALPPPPKLPAAAAPPVPALDALAPAAPPAPSAPSAAQPVSAGAQSLRAINVFPGPKTNAPSTRLPAFRALNLVASPGDVAAERLGLRYTVLKKSPAGELTAVDPRNELNRDDEVVIRFQSSEAGFLSVSQLDVPNGLRVIASERLVPSVPYTVPSSGTLNANSAGSQDLFVMFSRLPQAAKKRGESVAVVSTSADVAAEAANFTITLKYK